MSWEKIAAAEAEKAESQEHLITSLFSLCHELLVELAQFRDIEAEEQAIANLKHNFKEAQ